jgi:hypothetical protein
MLDSLVVLIAKKALYTIFIFEVDIPQDIVPLHYFVKNIEIKWEFVHRFNLLHELSANWASDPKVMMEVR